MSDLSEQEIFDRLDSSFARAIELCRSLATFPEKGQTYAAFRDELDLVDGCCQQASQWREDTRWLTVGEAIHGYRLLAQRLLMGESVQGSIQRVMLSKDHALKCFTIMANQLEGVRLIGNQIRHARTGRRGMILPDMPNPDRDTRPVRVILPPGMNKTDNGSFQAAGQALQ